MDEAQAVAAAWYVLEPRTWGWLAALAAVGVTAALARAPAIPLSKPVPDRWTPRQHRTALALVVLAALLVHAGGLWGEFNLFDDERQIHADAAVRAGDLAALGWNPRGTNQQLMYLSFVANWRWAGDAYAWWYAANLALLPALLLLVARIAWRLTDDRRVALLATGAFAVQPILVELLAWMSARSHYYGLVLGLLSAACWLEWLRSRRWAWYGGSVLAFAASQLAKPIFLFVPLWLLLFDLWHGRRDLQRMIFEKIPHGAVALLALLSILDGGTRYGRLKSTPLGGGYGATLLQDLNLVVEYARSLVIPYETGLLVPYNTARGWLAVDGVPQVLPFGFAPLASAILLACGIAAAALLAVRWRWGLPLLVAVGSLLTLLTVLNVPFRGTAAVFEYRYTLSAHVLAGVLLADVLVRLPWRQLALGGGVAWLALALLTTHAQQRAWSSSEAFWVRNAELYPRSYFAHYYAGKALQRKGRFAFAVHHLEEAGRNHPADAMWHRRLGDCWWAMGVRDRAKPEYVEYFRRNPGKLTAVYERRLREVGVEPKPR